jgi:hypothetical protein
MEVIETPWTISSSSMPPLPLPLNYDDGFFVDTAAELLGNTIWTTRKLMTRIRRFYGLFKPYIVPVQGTDADKWVNGDNNETCCLLSGYSIFAPLQRSSQ